jgi:gluconokinase
MHASPSNPKSPTNLIVVMGVSGSGKSTLAEKIALYYGYSYLDADDFHSQEAKSRMASGLPLTDTLRQPWVANICARLQQALVQQEHIVLAFSGLRRAHRQILRNQKLKTLVLFLEGDETTIQARVDKRPNHFMNPSQVRSQFDTLEEPVDEADVIRIDIHTTSEHILKQALANIEKTMEIKS